MLGTHVWGSGCREAEGAGEREGPGRCAQASALRWLAVAKRAGVNRAVFSTLPQRERTDTCYRGGGGGEKQETQLILSQFCKKLTCICKYV